jgi:hypothetical protein
MTNVRHPAIAGASEASDRASTRKGIFTHLLDALHESRRIEAARLIGRYRHLLSTGPRIRTTPPIRQRRMEKEVSKMPTNIDPPRAQRSEVLMSNSAMISMAVVLAVFAVLHLMAAAMLQPESAAPPAEDTRFAAHGD